MQRNLLSYLEQAQQPAEAQTSLDIDALSTLFPSFQKIEASFNRAHSAIQNAVEYLKRLEDIREDIRQEIEREYEDWEKTVGKAFPSSPAFQCVRRMKELALKALEEDDKFLDEVGEAVDSITEYVNQIESELAPLVNEVERIIAQLNILERKFELERKMLKVGGRSIDEIGDSSSDDGIVE